jgi:hypothetical protein
MKTDKLKIDWDKYPRDMGPAGCEDEAVKAERAGNYAEAYGWWCVGSARCLGHKRAERYDAAAARCRKIVEGDIFFGDGFAVKDGEVFAVVLEMDKVANTSIIKFPDGSTRYVDELKYGVHNTPDSAKSWAIKKLHEEIEKVTRDAETRVAELYAKITRLTK